ncbi:HlyD family secretion protein [Edaphobacter bradus]|uniref:HlyD family secretion protein n=1 Tax=Edaphobacter bradus TaxID=2259016 RepID=UPI0021DFA668|nr:HlyD family secretion protein [Edaphobacter bradus]
MSSKHRNTVTSMSAVLEEEGASPEPVPEPAAETPEPTRESRPSRPAHRRKIIFAAVALVVILTATGYFARDAYLYQDTDDAQVDGHIMPLSSRITGQIQKVNVVQGQRVSADEVLAVIDPNDYKVADDQARAFLLDAEATAASSHSSVPISSATAWSSLDSSTTEVTNAEAGVSAAERNLDAARANEQQAEANSTKTDADLIRYQQLVAEQVISQQQFDQANASAKANRAAVVAAIAQVQSAQQALRQAQGKLLQAQAALRNAQTAPQQVSVARDKADAAEATVKERAAQLAQADLNLSYTIVRSPVDGIVGRKSVEVGQNVGVGQELFQVVPLDDIWVTANFKETQLAHMRPGQPVEIKVDAYGRTWKGHVTNMGGGAGSVFSLLPPENATGNYVKVVQRIPVRIDFDRSPRQVFNADGLLEPGLSVDPKVRVR